MVCYPDQFIGCREEGAGSRVQGGGCRGEGAGRRVQGGGCSKHTAVPHKYSSLSLGYLVLL